MSQGPRVIIAGSRTVPVSIETVKRLGEHLKRLRLDHPSLVLSGGANGADQVGEWWAREIGAPCRVYPALWEVHGRKAGILRNQEMADNADALVAIWDGKSFGTANMIKEARKRKLRVYIMRVPIEVGSEGKRKSILELAGAFLLSRSDRKVIGLAFTCPACRRRRTHRIEVGFEDHPEGKSVSASGLTWRRDGDVLAGVTVRPAIDCTGPGSVCVFHGRITAGQVEW